MFKYIHKPSYLIIYMRIIRISNFQTRFRLFNSIIILLTTISFNPFVQIKFCFINFAPKILFILLLIFSKISPNDDSWLNPLNLSNQSNFINITVDAQFLHTTFATRQCHAAEGAAQIKGVFWFYQRRRVLFHTTQRHRRRSSQYSIRPTLDTAARHVSLFSLFFFFFLSFFLFLIVTKDERSTHAVETRALCLTIASWNEIESCSRRRKNSDGYDTNFSYNFQTIFLYLFKNSGKEKTVSTSR